jgi:hypothetical protein
LADFLTYSIIFLWQRFKFSHKVHEAELGETIVFRMMEKRILPDAIIRGEVYGRRSSLEGSRVIAFAYLRPNEGQKKGLKHSEALGMQTIINKFKFAASRASPITRLSD